MKRDWLRVCMVTALVVVVLIRTGASVFDDVLYGVMFSEEATRQVSFGANWGCIAVLALISGTYSSNQNGLVGLLGLPYSSCFSSSA